MSRGPNVIDLRPRRQLACNARLLAAAKAALEVMDTMHMADLAEGKDAPVRAELKAAIDAIEDGEPS